MDDEFAGLKPGDQVYITGHWTYDTAEVDWVGRLWFTVKGNAGHRTKFRLTNGRNNTDYTVPYAVSIAEHERRQLKARVQELFRTYKIDVSRSVLTLEQLESLSAHLPRLNADE